MVTQVVRAPLPQLSICPEERLDELQAAGAVNSLSCPTTRNKKSLIHGGVPKNSVMCVWQDVHPCSSLTGQDASSWLKDLDQ